MKRTLEKPAFEQITPRQGDSITVRQFSSDARNTRPFWHYHPELEMVYVNGGSGKRHIGSHLSYFHKGELVLIGSNLPHQGFSDRLNNYEKETVVQMLPDFMGHGFLQQGEMSQIAELFERAKHGLVFHGDVKTKVGEKIESLVDFDPFNRILRLLEIFQDLALTDQYQKLNAKGFSIEIQPQDNDRINIVLNYVRENFQNPISLADITDQIGMTEPSFCRYFKKVTGKTFTRFVNEYRLVHASKLLAEKQISILEVCFESGFTNYSHFTKQFKSFNEKSPSKYRSELTQVIE